MFENYRLLRESGIIRKLSGNFRPRPQIFQVWERGSVCGFTMAEGGDSNASVTGHSTATEGEAIAAPPLLATLRCPQPAAIARKRKVTISPPPRGKRRSGGRGNFDLKSVTLHNECESSLTSGLAFRQASFFARLVGKR